MGFGGRPGGMRSPGRIIGGVLEGFGMNPVVDDGKSADRLRHASEVAGQALARREPEDREELQRREAPGPVGSHTPRGAMLGGFRRKSRFQRGSKNGPIVYAFLC